MAGGGGTSGFGGRRKSLDAEINLVPFIDLLSMCISFLLLTVVWINIGAVQVKQSHGTEAAATTSKQYEMDISYLSPSSLEVKLKRGSASKKYVVKGTDTADMLAKFDTAVGTWDETKDAEKIASARVTPAVRVSYGDLIDTLDVLRKHKIVNLAVLPGSRGGM
jgi:biopolymer transport protein TolR